jgi:hypothetical protein
MINYIQLKMSEEDLKELLPISKQFKTIILPSFDGDYYKITIIFD